MAEKKSFFNLSLQKLKQAFATHPETPAEHAQALVEISKALSVAVKKIFFEKSQTKFTSTPIVSRKTIVQFKERLRIDAMEKFNATTALSAVHFYRDARALRANAPLGVLIIYIEHKFVPEMLRLLQYPYIDYEEDKDVLDGAGAIANLIAGTFKAELKGLGYADLEMSHFRSFINKAPEGIEYPVDQTERYELSFEIEGQKRLVAEMVMAPLPKRDN